MAAWDRADHTPALQPAELYDLARSASDVRPLVHPLLALEDERRVLRYDLATGETRVFVADSHKEEPFAPLATLPATLPRLTEILIVPRGSPWICRVRNAAGVTLADVFVQLWRDYADTPITRAEYDALGPREQDQLERRARRRSGSVSPRAAAGLGLLPQGGSPAYAAAALGYGYSPYGPAPYAAPLYGTPPAVGARGRSPAELPKRTDWLLGKSMFNGLRRDDEYMLARLGFVPPNAFVLELIR